MLKLRRGLGGDHAGDLLLDHYQPLVGRNSAACPVCYTFGWVTMPPGSFWHTVMQVTMTAEGILWALAAGMLARVGF